MKKDKGKITNFNTYRPPDETEEDKAFDRELRRKFVEDGNKEAWRIQNDYPQDDMGSSQELYLKIVQNLRDKGLWDDEAYEEAVREEKQKNVYANLSEEDRYALERGRMAILREKKWKPRLKKLRNMAAGVLIVGGIFSVSMASEANREQAMRIWTTVMGFGQNIYISREDDSSDGTTKVDDAIKDIKKALGMDAPRFEYLPDGIKYRDCEINQEMRLAKITYDAGNSHLLYIYITKEETDVEDMLVVDGEIVDEFPVSIDLMGKEVEVEKIQQAKNDYIYKTEFITGDALYIICGEVQKEEFNKILNKLYI